MILFFTFFLAIYGGVHVYTFVKAKHAFGFGWPLGMGVALFMAFMIGALLIIRSLERAEYELSARTLSYIAYLWMAVLFLFFCGSLVLDAANLLFQAVDRVGGPGTVPFRISAKLSFVAPLTLSCLICIYGYFDAQNIRTERLVIETEKLPVGMDRLTIAQLSDVHLGLIIRCDRLVNILERVKAVNPDIVLSTGDLVDAQINHLSGLRELLQDIRPRYGKYAITGNHEYFAGLDKALEFTRHSGFTMLRNEARTIGGITIAGMDDRTGNRLKKSKPMADSDILSRLDRKQFILFLKHEPLPDPDAVGLFDLMLSGHTHKGQIWPFIYLTRMTYPLNAGKYDLGKGSLLYVSRGSGTWGPPIRFLSPPEITVIELVRKRSA